MSQVDSLRHGLLVTREGGIEKGFGILYRLGQRLPRGCLHSFIHLVRHLFIRDITFLSLIVVGQVAEMNQHGEDIILAPHDMHVIEELRGIYIDMLSGQHTDNVILQPIEIHLNVGDDRVVGTCGCPVASANTSLQGFHHGIGIVNGLLPSDSISVIPHLQVFHRCVMTLR